MLRRLLVANRGEIARRLIRGAHDAGCEAVAVYAADDAASPHVGEADLAVLLPGASLAQTYLSTAALVGVRSSPPWGASVYIAPWVMSAAPVPLPRSSGLMNMDGR